MQTSVEHSMRFYATMTFVLMGVLLTILIVGERPSRAQDPCRLEEARQISCAAAKTSYGIDHSWPRAQGIFSSNMTYLNCNEPRKWDGVCR